MPRALLPPAPGSGAAALEIEYETFGSDGLPSVLLIAGWGAQLISWDVEFCEALAGRGYRVIRFDNRDAGLSSKIEDGSTYSLDDMAADAVGLLDVLRIERAHIVGASMGGMIAQSIAIHHLSRVLSLTSIMSTTGAPDVGYPSDAARELLSRPLPHTRDERIQASIDSCRATWGDSEDLPFDEVHARRRAEASDDRSYYPPGKLRQILAIGTSGDRTTSLRQLDVPALVVHGDNDGLVHVSGGEATAAAIPGAELVLVKGMGHVVDPRAWTRILDAFERVAARAERPPAAATDTRR